MNVDRIGDPQTLTSIILLLVIGGLLSCDTVSPEQKNEQKNPYADFVDTYSDAASASLKYVREQRPTDRKQVRQLLAQGYRQWVDRNESRAESSFGQFQELEAVQRSVQKHLSRSPRAKRKELLSVDSLLAIADLTTDQQIQLKKLFGTLEDVNSYSELNLSLTRFENRSRNELGRGSRKVVLQISALIRAQSKFIAEADSTTNVSMAYLAAIGDSTAINARQERFGRPQLPCARTISAAARIPRAVRLAPPPRCPALPWRPSSSPPLRPRCCS